MRPAWLRGKRWFLLRENSSLLGQNGNPVENLSQEKQLSCILDNVASQGIWSAGAVVNQLLILRVHQSHFRAICEQPAEGLAIPIVLVRATEFYPDNYDASPEVAPLDLNAMWGWSRSSSRPVEVVDLRGNHQTMLLDSHVSILPPSPRRHP